MLHGHGAKAGAFMRLRTASRDRIRSTLRHGGSLHYPLSTLKGNIYARVERALMNDTDLFLFESAFAREHLSAHHRHAEGTGAMRVQRRYRQ